MTHKNSWTLPTFTQLAHAALLWTAHASGQAAAAQGFKPSRASLGGTGAAQALDASEAFSAHTGRSLTQAGASVPGVTPAAPGVTALVPTGAKNQTATKTPVRVLIPDNYNYGAFDAPLYTTLNRVRFAVEDEGADIILYDLFAGNRSQSVDQNATRLSEAVTVINLATSLGRPGRGGPV